MRPPFHFCMSPRSPRPTSQPHDAAERRLRVALRMPLLATSQALIYIIGLVCALFGAGSWAVTHQSESYRQHLAAELGEVADAATLTSEMHLAVDDSQRLCVVICAYGLLCLGVGKFLYHAPLLVPIVATVGFIPTFYAFLKYNHSEELVIYILCALLILGALIISTRLGQQFRQSYARMGRPHEK